MWLIQQLRLMLNILKQEHSSRLKAQGKLSKRWLRVRPTYRSRGFILLIARNLNMKNKFIFHFYFYQYLYFKARLDKFWCGDIYFYPWSNDIDNVHITHLNTDTVTHHEIELLENYEKVDELGWQIDLHYEHGGQRKRTKYTVPQVDKETSLHCYYVKMCRTGEYMWHLFYTFLHNSSEGMFLCLPEELYILSAFFVSHIHSAGN